MIGSWGKEGTLRDIQSVAPTGWSCVPGPGCHCGVLGRGSYPLGGLELAPTVNSIKIGMCLCGKLCPLNIGYT